MTLPDEKTIRIALHEYAGSVRILALQYSEDLAQLQLRLANERRSREEIFNAALRDQRIKLLKKLGLEDDS